MSGSDLKVVRNLSEPAVVDNFPYFPVTRLDSTSSRGEYARQHYDGPLGSATGHDSDVPTIANGNGQCQPLFT